MATVHADTSGNWSATGTWDTDTVPVAGDIVIIDTGVTVAIDVARVPATAGDLASLTGAGTGKCTIATATNTNCEIHVSGNITAGGPATPGFIALADTASSASLVKVWAADILAGTSTAGCAIGGVSRATITLTFANLKGGTGLNSHGVWVNVSLGNLVIVGGNVYSGTSTTPANGILMASTITSLVITAGTKFINSSGVGVALANSPTSWAPNADDYWTWGFGNLAKELLDHQILTTIKNGSITGNRVDCPVAKAIDSSGNYGDPAAPLVGTIVTRTLPTADDHVHVGYYEETTLATVDTDLVAGNIVSGKTIFGVAGSASAGGGAVVGPFEIEAFR